MLDPICVPELCLIWQLTLKREHVEWCFSAEAATGWTGANTKSASRVVVRGISESRAQIQGKGVLIYFF